MTALQRISEILVSDRNNAKTVQARCSASLICGLLFAGQSSKFVFHIATYLSHMTGLGVHFAFCALGFGVGG